jgi:phage regulator Rha-like protein
MAASNQVQTQPKLGTPSLTITSLDIAERTGKEHKNVLADIRKVLDDLDMRPAEFSAGYRDAKGETRECFILPKREALILATGYSTKLRASIIDRLEELELESNPLLTLDAVPEIKHKVMVLLDAQKALNSFSKRSARAEFFEEIVRVLKGKCEFDMYKEADLLLARIWDYIENSVQYYNVEHGYIRIRKGKWKCEPNLSYRMNEQVVLVPKIADREEALPEASKFLNISLGATSAETMSRFELALSS